MRPRHLVWLILPLSLVTFGAVMAQEKFPQKPVTLVIQFPPGGGADITGRAIASVIEKYLTQPMTVVNKPGGAGLVAGDFLVKSKPDGYTIASLVSTGCDPELFGYFRKAGYKYEDMVPVIRVAFDPYGLIVKSGTPWKTLREFIDHVKANPKKVTWGHQGLGHSYHLRGTALSQENGLEMNDVAFGGSAAEVMAVLGGKIDSAIVSIAGSRSFLEEGSLRMLAVQHPTRLTYLPNIPTFAEQGFDVGFPLHYGAFFAPKGTPQDRVKILHDAVKKTLEDGVFTEMMKKGGSDILYGSAQDLQKDVDATRRVYGAIFRKLGMQ